MDSNDSFMHKKPCFPPKVFAFFLQFSSDYTSILVVFIETATNNHVIFKNVKNSFLPTRVLALKDARLNFSKKNFFFLGLQNQKKNPI